MNWRLAFRGTKDSPAMVDGINVWDYQWNGQGDMPLETCIDDSSSQTASLAKYFIQSKGRIVEFAAGEVSPGLWLVHEPYGSRLDLHFILSVTACFVAALGGFILFHGATISVQQAFLGWFFILFGLFCGHHAKSLRTIGEA